MSDRQLPAILGIHHVAIICSNYRVSKRFYSEHLGFSIIAENFREERQSYKLDLQVPGGVQIELFSFDNAPKRPSFPEAQGLRHLAFAVLSVDAFAEYLMALNIDVEPIRIDPYTNKKFTFFNDPDGLPLEIYESND